MPAEVGRFRAAMDDDFNTPEALAVMQGVARTVNLAKAAGKDSAVANGAATLRALGAILGVLQPGPRHLFETQCRNQEPVGRGDRGAAGRAPRGAFRQEFCRIGSDPRDF